MKTKNNNSSDEMLPEYNFSGGIRGKHFKQLQDGYTVTVYSPNQEVYSKNLAEKIRYIRIDKDISEYFQNSEDVNKALRALISIFPKKRKHSA